MKVAVTDTLTRGAILGIIANLRYPEVRILETTDTLLSKVQSGKGSLGLLARDSTLYLETTKTVQQMRQLLSDIQANPRKYFRFSVF